MKTVPKPHFVYKTCPVKNGKRVIFFFTSYGTKAWFFKNTYRQLNKLGYIVVAYQFPGRELTRIDGAYLNDLRQLIQDDVDAKLEQYKSHGISEFASFGASMGAVYSIGIAKATPDIKRMVMVTAYGNCARFVWENPKLKKSKQLYADRGLTMQQVHELYPSTEPLAHINKLKDKTMLLYVSRSDTMIRFENTNEFIQKAKQQNLNLEVIEGKGAHIPFITKTLLSDKRWRDFLA